MKRSQEVVTFLLILAFIGFLVWLASDYARTPSSPIPDNCIYAPSKGGDMECY